MAVLGFQDWAERLWEHFPDQRSDFLRQHNHTRIPDCFVAQNHPFFLCSPVRGWGCESLDFITAKECLWSVRPMDDESYHKLTGP